jgi:hypothetical protein
MLNKLASIQYDCSSNQPDFVDKDFIERWMFQVLFINLGFAYQHPMPLRTWPFPPSPHVHVLQDEQLRPLADGNFFAQWQVSNGRNCGWLLSYCSIDPLLLMLLL